MPGLESVSPSLVQRTIALVDAYADEREMYGEYLARLGYQVLAVGNVDLAADSALAFIERVRPHAIVLRIGRQQPTLLKVLQPVASARCIPVLALTTNLDRAAWERVREDGASAVYLLPLTPAALGEALRYFLEPGHGSPVRAS